MKVLVTGGGGFLGSAICRQLRAGGHTVFAFGRNRYPALEAQQIASRQGDIANLDSVATAAEDVDAIVHSAGKVGAWGRLEDYYETNVRGTDNVLAACELHRIGKLVFTSSPSVVHAGQDLEGVDESAPYAVHFSSAYAQTKALAEQRVLAANGPALATVALRPHFIWGPGDPNLLPRVLKQARAGRLRIIGRGDKRIDTTYVDNAADAHVLALDRIGVGSPIAGKTYFISQGEPISHEVLINAWLKANGFPPETRHLPLGLAKFIGDVLETVYGTLRIQSEPPLSRFVVEQMSTAHWFNIDAARRDLGYSPKVSTTEGLVRLSEYMARERMQQRA